jgi:hypothetical protein
VSRVIRIDDEVAAHLKANARPFESRGAVISRLLATPTTMTENGYALCNVHAEQWRSGGWSGRMYPIEECTTPNEFAQMVCADCDDKEEQ